jgi:hypothetical protein
MDFYRAQKDAFPKFFNSAKGYVQDKYWKKVRDSLSVALPFDKVDFENKEYSDFGYRKRQFPFIRHLFDSGRDVAY